MTKYKHAGPNGAWCPGCGTYQSMRNATQVRAARAHYAACPQHIAFMAERAARA